LLGRQEVKQLLEGLKDRYNVVIDELIPDVLRLGEVQDSAILIIKRKSRIVAGKGMTIIAMIKTTKMETLISIIVVFFLLGCCVCVAIYPSTYPFP
ncbi:hypothetical protein, partial [Jeotgalibaca porci]|uniref:hypothetical protein n=1 Tax=Jeotgalibaca porci TaxID=1868793 RepID=UPI0035A16065